MKHLSPFILAAILVALGLTACSSHDKDSNSGQPEQMGPVNPANDHKDLLDGQQPSLAFYVNGESTPLYDLIEAAKSSLDIAIYEMGDPRILGALRRALDRKVAIRVIKEPEPFNSKCALFAVKEGKEISEGCKDERRFKREVLAAGGSYVPFNRENLCGDPVRRCFLHGKMVIADSRAVLLSTGNFSKTNLCNLDEDPDRCNRDYTMLTRDAELVGFFSSVFANDLKGEKYDLASLITPSVQAKATVSPYSLYPLVSLIHSANKTIRIANQYLKDKDMNAALVAAAMRGVHVEVTLASLCAFGPPKPETIEESKELLSSLEEAGIEIRMLPARLRIQGKPGYMHAKALLVDDTNAWVGSVNGSWTALSNNREFGLIFSEPNAVKALASSLIDDHVSPDVETWQESLDCKKDNAAFE